MFRWLCVAALLAGCGAKTGAEVDPAAEREPTPFDAGFDTFPCRWSLAQPTVVARTATGFAWSAGAIHAVLDQAFVVWSTDTAGGARLMLGDPPAVLSTFGPGALPSTEPSVMHGVLVDVAHQWLAHERGAPCTLRTMGEAPPWTDSSVLDGASECWLEPHHPHRIDVTLRRGDDVILWSQLDPPPPVMRVIDAAEATAPRSVYLPPLGWIVVSAEDRRLVVRRVTDDDIEWLILDDVLRPEFALAPDRVRSGAVVLWRARTGWRIERYPFEGELRSIPLADLGALDAEPLGTMTTNETEALFPLSDGRVAVVPVDGSAMRFIGPVPAVAGRTFEVVLRPGTSGGGLLYERDGRGERQLVFQPLTCNR